MATIKTPINRMVTIACSFFHRVFTILKLSKRRLILCTWHVRTSLCVDLMIAIILSLLVYIVSGHEKLRYEKEPIVMSIVDSILPGRRDQLNQHKLIR